MPSAEYNTSPREIRNFAALQLGLTGAFLIALFWFTGATDANYPPPWLSALLVVPIIVAVVFAERVWLTGAPLSADLDGFHQTSQAIDVYASQTFRKLLYVEASMLPAIAVAFAGSYGGWPIVVAGFPGALALAWEIYPTQRNTSRTAAMLDSRGAQSELVERFRAL